MLQSTYLIQSIDSAISNNDGISKVVNKGWFYTI